MHEIKIGHQSAKTVFHLLGTNENGMTFSLGWCLAHNDPFLKRFCRHFRWSGSLDDIRIHLQKHDSIDGGYTDLELSVPGQWGAIVEAKRGYLLPNVKQLRRYSSRPCLSAPISVIGVLTNHREDYVGDLAEFRKPIGKSAIMPLSWKSVYTMGKQSIGEGAYTQRRLLEEFLRYLKGIVEMQKQTSNLVYVVSLGSGTEKGWGISWIDIVAKRRRYFHPIGINGWPSEPPNYLGFRYHGKLQSVRHVERVKVLKQLHSEFPEIPAVDGSEWPHFLYHLGAEIKPTSLHLPTGANWRANRVECMLDTLLTSHTIREALDVTKRRMAVDAS